MIPTAVLKFGKPGKARHQIRLRRRRSWATCLSTCNGSARQTGLAETP